MSREIDRLAAVVRGDPHHSWLAKRIANLYSTVHGGEVMRLVDGTAGSAVAGAAQRRAGGHGGHG
ncbi:MAG: hypothetical protein R2709_06440 [Marmoricola sp.]